MRKILSLLTVSMLLLLSSCELNEMPEFDDGNAFVAFDNTSMSVEEDDGSISIPVTLASVKGVSGTVSYQVLDGTQEDDSRNAKEGVNYVFPEETGTLTFDAENRTQYIEIDIIHLDDVYTGNLRFHVQLLEDGVVKPSAEDFCTITINDLDHPHISLLGDWTATGTSYFNGEQVWEMNIEADELDTEVVWIYPFVEDGSSFPVYGNIYQEEDTYEIRVPVGQELVSPSGDYSLIELRGYYGPDGEEEISSGGYVTIVFEGEGSMTILDEIGSYVWFDKDEEDGAGWYNLFQANIALTK